MSLPSADLKFRRAPDTRSQSRGSGPSQATLEAGGGGRAAACVWTCLPPHECHLGLRASCVVVAFRSPWLEPSAWSLHGLRTHGSGLRWLKRKHTRAFGGRGRGCNASYLENYLATDESSCPLLPGKSTPIASQTVCFRS